MAKNENQKLKLYYLYKILKENTDENHGLSMPQLLSMLEEYGIKAERKSIYNDVVMMREYMNLDIISERKGPNSTYYLATRDFELAEVKILIDAIQSCKFVTNSKSKKLIKKLKTLVSPFQAAQLQRQVYTASNVKLDNEKIYYNVDYIYQAINENHIITFKYANWDLNKKLVERHKGVIYTVSPWALIWDNENYYLLAYDHNEEKLKHYRVDKMIDINVSDDNRLGKSEFKKLDMSEYTSNVFSMYHGDITNVTIRFENDKVGIFIDRFGKKIEIESVDDNHSQINVEVAVSPTFFGWIFSLGQGVEIVSPDSVINKLKAYTKEFTDMYR